MKYSYIIFFLLISLSVISQEKYAKEFSFITDNDLYVSKNKDRYYTSGIFLSYQYLSKKKNTRLEKKILEWQIGHKMYTPFKAIVQDVSLHDRPFAGYLYGSFGINKVYKNNQILKTSVQIGMIGSAAFSKELQDFIHDIYGFQKAIGWEHQIKSAFALNFEGNYTRHLVKDASNHYDISWTNTIKIGTVFTDISTGFYGRIGFKPLQKLANSIAFNTNLNDTDSDSKREIESFLYIKPTLGYFLYDATIQGSFLNKQSPVTKTLTPFKFELELGLRFTINRFNFGYFVNYQTNKQRDLRYQNGNIYGTILINYLIR